tara:strand:+ start:1172 stop:3271 length:2100 start_codon:yes stop_codon:yes gene_type:complete
MDIMRTSLEYLNGIGPAKAQLLKNEMQLKSFQDLLHFFPHRYVDRSQFFSINTLPANNSEVQIKGRVKQLKWVNQKRGKRLVAEFEDETGQLELVWFRGHQWVAKSIQLNQEYIIFGRLNWYLGLASMPHPEMTLAAAYEKEPLRPFQPIYRSTEKMVNSGLTQTSLQKMVSDLFLKTGQSFRETLPEKILARLSLVSKAKALTRIHFPESQNALSRAQMRLKFEELFYIQLQLLLKNYQRKQKIKGHIFESIGHHFNSFYKEELPFALTNAQKRVIKEIRNDLGSGRQMNRLLQGDVGSGKTIVALLTMLIAVDNSFQACLVAPTEILAQQHYESLSILLKNSTIHLALLTGSTKKEQRQKLHDELESGALHILIGTHAILVEKVIFKSLGLAIIDEQHRFGVAQRARLWKKNKIPPHILVMTATPIPRTLAMSLYGDLDSSIIDELPPGRKPVKTVHRLDRNRLKVFAFLKESIAKGQQVYIVYPLIQESEKLDYKNLMEGYESIQRTFPNTQYQISILHGQMTSEAKAIEMDRFVQQKTQIMVATTVIEVGVNVPNASVMVIESAERFGLSQLHQLRGRIGRGSSQSYCILMSNEKLSEEARTRINTMVQTQDGFELAEVDLRLRGPGNLMGTQQSGLLQLKIANVVKDTQLLQTARAYAQEIIKKDPNLETEEHQNIKYTLAQIQFHQNIWNFIS